MQWVCQKLSLTAKFAKIQRVRETDCLLLAVFLVLPISASSQISPDPQIMAEVNQIKAVDNHTHVPKVVGPGEKDDDFDALPCDPLEPTKAPLMARPENPKFLEAWQKLYGYTYSDPAHFHELVAMKQQVQKEQEDNYPAWVIDKLGIEYMLPKLCRSARAEF